MNFGDTIPPVPPRRPDFLLFHTAFLERANASWELRWRDRPGVFMAHLLRAGGRGSPTPRTVVPGPRHRPRRSRVRAPASGSGWGRAGQGRLAPTLHAVLSDVREPVASALDPVLRGFCRPQGHGLCPHLLSQFGVSGGRRRPGGGGAVDVATAPRALAGNGLSGPAPLQGRVPRGPRGVPLSRWWWTEGPFLFVGGRP